MKPRWAFWKGMLVGAAIEVPILATAVWALAQIGFGDPDVDFMHVMRLTALFAGIASLFTAGGIGRLAAYASVDGGRKRAMFVAARAHAAASAGLVLIAAIPHGHMPTVRYSYEWLAYPAAGIVAGVAAGVVIGVVCGGATPVALADVWSLARQPSKALRTLLSPEDLVRLGSVLRTRTTQMFEGIFEPAPLPPSKSNGSDSPAPPIAVVAAAAAAAASASSARNAAAPSAKEPATESADDSGKRATSSSDRKRATSSNITRRATSSSDAKRAPSSKPAVATDDKPKPDEAKTDEANAKPAESSKEP